MALTATEQAVIDRVKRHLIDDLGYRCLVSADGLEERWIRPDGSVAIIARRSDASVGATQSPV